MKLLSPRGEIPISSHEPTEHYPWPPSDEVHAYPHLTSMFPWDEDLSWLGTESFNWNNLPLEITQ